MVKTETGQKERKIKGKPRKKQRLAKTPCADQFLGGEFGVKIEDCALDYADGSPLVGSSFTARNFNASRCHSEASTIGYGERFAPSRTAGRSASACGICHCHEKQRMVKPSSEPGCAWSCVEKSLSWPVMRSFLTRILAGSASTK